MKKHILHIVKDFPVRSETFVSNHIAQCVSSHYETTVFTDHLHTDKDVWETQSNAIIKENATLQSYQATKEYSKFLKLLKALFLLLKNLHLSPLFFKSLGLKYGALGKSLKLWFLIPEYAAYRDVAIVHSHFGSVGELTAIMKDIGVVKGKTVISFYGFDTFSSASYQPNLSREYNFLKKNTDHIITSSKYLKSNLENLNLDKDLISVIHVGLDPTNFEFIDRSHYSNQEIRLLCLGRLIHLKGQHLAIEALALLDDKNVHLDILGDGIEMENLKKLTSKLGLENNVHFHGNVVEQDIKKAFVKADIFLMTSITDENGRAEGQGLVTAEAQASGLPVIAFDSGGVGETVITGTTGYLIEEGDVSAFAKAIKSLIENHTLRLQFGKNARTLVETNFDQREQSQKIIQLYDNLLDG